jgi:hypothetical protein
MIQAGSTWHLIHAPEPVLAPAAQYPPSAARQICLQSDHAVDHDFRTTQMQPEARTRRGDPRPLRAGRSDCNQGDVSVRLRGVADYWAG